MVGKILSALDKVLTFFEEWTLFITVLVALVALFFNVVLRYGFNYSLAWSEELVREVIIYTTLILIFALTMIYYGWLLAALQVQTNQKTIILQIPLVFIFSFLPLMGVLMLIRVIHVIYQDIQELKVSKQEN